MSNIFNIGDIVAGFAFYEPGIQYVKNLAIGKILISNVKSIRYHKCSILDLYSNETKILGLYSDETKILGHDFFLMRCIPIPHEITSHKDIFTYAKSIYLLQGIIKDE